MNIKSKWGNNAHAGKIVSIVDGKRIFIHLRSTFETHSSSDISGHRGERLHTVSIDNVQKVADHMSEPFTHVKQNDVVVLLCASDEARTAALAVLGLGEG